MSNTLPNGERHLLSKAVWRDIAQKIVELTKKRARSDPPTAFLFRTFYALFHTKLAASVSMPYSIRQVIQIPSGHVIDR